jgi:hydroxyacylglutathione hydrolase
MKLKQIYTGCIAHAAYYLESNGEVAIFDPLREVQPYIDQANDNVAKIKYVFETHFHADFVSGHLDLAAKTGATIVYGPTAKPGFEAHVATDGEVFNVGKAKVKVIHTPGHTMESTTYLVIDEDGKEHGIITGDTLFIGDVGRPDLAQHVIADLTEEKLAGAPVRQPAQQDHAPERRPDRVPQPWGRQRLRQDDEQGDHRHARQPEEDQLRPSSRHDQGGVHQGTAHRPHCATGLLPQERADEHPGLREPGQDHGARQDSLHPTAFEVVANEERPLVLDTRPASEFAKGFIPNSINIGLDSNFAMWVGEMIPDIKQSILLVTAPGTEEESIIRLSRVGYDNTIGFLKGGFPAWKAAGKEVDTVQRINATEFAKPSTRPMQW